MPVLFFSGKEDIIIVSFFQVKNSASQSRCFKIREKKLENEKISIERRPNYYE